MRLISEPLPELEKEQGAGSYTDTKDKSTNPQASTPLPILA